MITSLHDQEHPEPTRCLGREEAVLVRYDIPVPYVGQERWAQKYGVEGIEVDHCVFSDEEIRIHRCVVYYFLPRVEEVEEAEE